MPVAAATMTPFPLLAALTSKKLLEMYRSRQGYGLTDSAGDLEAAEANGDVIKGPGQSEAKDAVKPKLNVKHTGCPVMPHKIKPFKDHIPKAP